jgi:hypothetical protein
MIGVGGDRGEAPDRAGALRQPGLQGHITYLAGMTGSAVQKIGRDAIER